MYFLIFRGMASAMDGRHIYVSIYSYNRRVSAVEGRCDFVPTCIYKCMASAMEGRHDYVTTYKSRVAAIEDS